MIHLRRSYCIKRPARFRLERNQFLNHVAASIEKSPHIVTQLFNDNKSVEYECRTGQVRKLKRSNSSLWLRAQENLNEVLPYFLPKGFPSSVGKGYEAYIKGQCVGILFSSACGVLSTQSLLYAMGLGIEALPVASTLNWVIKDGIGQFGGVLFASLVNNKFDGDPKRWRLLASISMDCASFIELLTPLVPSLFLPLASIANIGKNISYLAASASRAAIHKSFAIHENLADVTAKSGSQSILASMTGTTIGIMLASMIGNDYSALITVFSILSSIHLISTYISLNYVTLNILNHSRFDYLFYNFQMNQNRILSPYDMLKEERLLSPPDLQLPALHVGSDLNDIISSNSDLEVRITLKYIYIYGLYYNYYIISFLYLYMK